MRYLEGLWLITIKQEIEVSSESYKAISSKEADMDWEINSNTEILYYYNDTPLFKKFIKYITN